MIELENLSFGYGAVPLFTLSAFKVKPGAHLLIKGPSGCGKTSLLFLLAGILKPTGGTIRLNGTDIQSLSAAARDAFRGRHIGFVFQQPHLINALNVLDNVLVAPAMGGLKADRTHALKLLERLGLAEYAHRRPHTLSHGQKQRVGIARALVHRPQWVLADEPTSALDDDACNAVTDLLLNTAKAEGAQVIAASHDHRLDSHFKQRLTLEGGR